MLVETHPLPIAPFPTYFHLSPTPSVFRDQREILLNTLPSRDGQQPKRSHGKINFKDLAKTMAARWRAIDPKDKEEYEKIAAVGRAKYLQQAKAWKKQQRKLAKDQKKKRNQDDDDTASSSVAAPAPPSSIIVPTEPSVPTGSNLAAPYPGLAGHPGATLDLGTSYGSQEMQNPFRTATLASMQMQFQPSLREDYFPVPNLPPRVTLGQEERAFSLPERRHSLGALQYSSNPLGMDALQLHYQPLTSHSDSSLPRHFSWAQSVSTHRRASSQPVSSDTAEMVPPVAPLSWDTSSQQQQQQQRNPPLVPPLPFAPASYATTQASSDFLREDLLPLDLGEQPVYAFSSGSGEDEGHPFQGLFDDS